MRLDYSAPYPTARSAVMGRNVVATSHPLASMAGMEMYQVGGNAADAIIAAAICLTVVEPTGCGIGSDAFAIVWDGQSLEGLNSSGRSPKAWTPERFAHLDRMPERGWASVITPGAVAAWAELNRRYGRLPLEQLAAPAIRHAREGFLVTPIIASLWAKGAEQLGNQPGFADCFMPGGRSPRSGELFRSEAHAVTLEEIAQTGGESFYRGALADRIIAEAVMHGSVLTHEDLASHRAEWVKTISQKYAGAVVHELPPNGQGLATLIGLATLNALPDEGKGPDETIEIHRQIEASKLALADIYEYVGDPNAMDVSPQELLKSDYIAGRAALIRDDAVLDPAYGRPAQGGTVCLSAADASGMMVSFIQSNYMGFGSGAVVPNTGISLLNRGAGFSLTPGHANEVGPSKRSFHTIIPGFAMTEDDVPLMAFGLMGGPMQAQGHIQLSNRILKYGQNPQAASDAPRWRVIGGKQVAVEPSFDPECIRALQALGHEIVIEDPDDAFAFGGAQIVMRDDSGLYVAGSDGRKDGLALAS